LKRVLEQAPNGNHIVKIILDEVESEGDLIRLRTLVARTHHSDTGDEKEVFLTINTAINARLAEFRPRLKATFTIAGTRGPLSLTYTDRPCIPPDNHWERFFCLLHQEEGSTTWRIGFVSGRDVYVDGKKGRRW